jgi:hypothetical protein
MSMEVKPLGRARIDGTIRDAAMDKAQCRALGSPYRHTARLLALLLLLLLPLSLVACAAGGPSYIPANADIDPYANMRRKAEELYQAGLTQERRKEWRKALQSYEQARLWDPDNRTDISDALNHARQESRAVAFTAPAPTATLQPVPPKGGVAAPTATGPLGPTPSVVPGRPLPTPTPTAVVASRAGYRSFRSTVYPYTVSYPSSWTVKGDTSGKGQEHVDMFLAPSGTAEALVLIQAQQLRRDITLDQYLALIENQLVEEAGGTVQDIQTRKVNGAFAYVLAYRLQSDGTYLAIRHALFLDGNRGWSIMLMATPGTTPDLVKVFDAMLETFILQNEPTRTQ